jgi:A/G-specific adenine glycosylase
LSVAPMRVARLGLDWRGMGQVRHGFTHFELIIDLLACRVPVIEAEGFVHPLDALEEAALPSVMWKCVRMAGSGEV